MPLDRKRHLIGPAVLHGNHPIHYNLQDFSTRVPPTPLEISSAQITRPA